MSTRTTRPPARGTPRTFPILWKLEDRPVLVVGGGPIATETVASLVRAGARITVVAPEVTAAIAHAAERGALEWKARTFRAGDVLGYRVVIASTGERPVDEAVHRDAAGWSIPVNVRNAPDLSDFYFAV